MVTLLLLSVWVLYSLPGCREIFVLFVGVEALVAFVWGIAWIGRMSERQRLSDPDYYAYLDFADFS